jgi:hypothetical protein
VGDLRRVVLVVFVLYWGPAIFVPFALAILLTFVLTPPVTALERCVGRVPAVLVVVTGVFTVLGLAGWAWRDRWRTWSRICPPIATTSERRSRTFAALAKAAPSRSCRKRSKASRPSWEHQMRPSVPRRDPSLSPRKTEAMRDSRGSVQSSDPWERPGSCW